MGKKNLESIGLHLLFGLLSLGKPEAVCGQSAQAPDAFFMEVPAATCPGRPTYALAVEPFLPLFNGFSASFKIRSPSRNSLSGGAQSLIFGGWYSKSTATYPKRIPYPGTAVNYSAIIAYRRYLFRNGHVEYQLYPGYTRFFETGTLAGSNSFSLFNELRIGYRLDFRLGRVPLLLNLQLPVGFTLYESNEPDGFRAARKQDPVFYIFIPNVFVGYRFRSRSMPGIPY